MKGGGLPYGCPAQGLPLPEVASASSMALSSATAPLLGPEVKRKVFASKSALSGAPLSPPFFTNGAYPCRYLVTDGGCGFPGPYHSSKFGLQSTMMNIVEEFQKKLDQRPASNTFAPRRCCGKLRRFIQRSGAKFTTACGAFAFLCSNPLKGHFLNT